MQFSATLVASLMTIAGTANAAPQFWKNLDTNVNINQNANANANLNDDTNDLGGFGGFCSYGAAGFTPIFGPFEGIVKANALKAKRTAMLRKRGYPHQYSKDVDYDVDVDLSKDKNHNKNNNNNYNANINKNYSDNKNKDVDVDRNIDIDVDHHTDYSSCSEDERPKKGHYGKKGDGKKHRNTRRGYRVDKDVDYDVDVDVDYDKNHNKNNNNNYNANVNKNDSDNKNKDVDVDRNIDIDVDHHTDYSSCSEDERPKKGHYGKKGDGKKHRNTRRGYGYDKPRTKVDKDVDVDVDVDAKKNHNNNANSNRNSNHNENDADNKNKDVDIDHNVDIDIDVDHHTDYETDCSEDEHKHRPGKGHKGDQGKGHKGHWRRGYRYPAYRDTDVDVDVDYDYSKNINKNNNWNKNVNYNVNDNTSYNKNKDVDYDVDIDIDTDEDRHYGKKHGKNGGHWRSRRGAGYGYDHGSYGVGTDGITLTAGIKNNLNQAGVQGVAGGDIVSEEAGVNNGVLGAIGQGNEVGKAEDFGNVYDNGLDGGIGYGDSDYDSPEDKEIKAYTDGETGIEELYEDKDTLSGSNYDKQNINLKVSQTQTQQQGNKVVKPGCVEGDYECTTDAAAGALRHRKRQVDAFGNPFGFPLPNFVNSNNNQNVNINQNANANGNIFDDFNTLGYPGFPFIGNEDFGFGAGIFPCLADVAGLGYYFDSLAAYGYGDEALVEDALPVE